MQAILAKFTRLFILASCLAAALWAPVASASFHLYQITEILAGGRAEFSRGLFADQHQRGHHQ